MGPKKLVLLASVACMTLGLNGCGEGFATGLLSGLMGTPMGSTTWGGFGQFVGEVVGGSVLNAGARMAAGQRPGQAFLGGLADATVVAQARAARRAQTRQVAPPPRPARVPEAKNDPLPWWAEGERIEAERTVEGAALPGTGPEPIPTMVLNG